MRRAILADTSPASQPPGYGHHGASRGRRSTNFVRVAALPTLTHPLSPTGTVGDSPSTVRLCLCSLETHRRVLSLRRNVSTPPCPCNHQRASIMQIGIMDPDKRLSWPGLLPDAVDLVCGETAINYAVAYADMRGHQLSNALTLCLVQSPCRAQEHSCATAPGPVSRPVRPGHLTLRDTRRESSSLLDEQQNNMVSLAE
jgi:hypothetical protein